MGRAYLCAALISEKAGPLCGEGLVVEPRPGGKRLPLLCHGSQSPSWAARASLGTTLTTEPRQGGKAGRGEQASGVGADGGEQGWRGWGGQL